MSQTGVVQTTTTATAGVAQSNGPVALVLPAIGQILIAFLGAFLAYLVWDYLNRPLLVPDGVVSKVVKHKKPSKPDQSSHYLQVKNKGRVPATRCRAELRLRGETEYPESSNKEDQIIAMNLPLGWADMRGNLLVHQKEDYSRNTRIPAKESVTTHLFRETTGYIMVAEWVDPSGKPVLHLPADEYDLENIGGNLGFNDNSTDYGLNQSDYQQSRKMDYEEFHHTRWETAEVVVSSEEGGGFKQGLSLNLDKENNQLQISLKD